jgi:hypothetical protein
LSIRITDPNTSFNEIDSDSAVSNHVDDIPHLLESAHRFGVENSFEMICDLYETD